MAMNCDDAFQRIQELELEKRKLQDDNERLERLRRAAQPPPVLAGDKTTIMQDRDGRPISVSTSDALAFYKEFAASLSSEELDDLVARGFNQRARPVGSEGRFANYDSFLKRVGPLTPENYGKLTEAFGQALRNTAPEEYGLLTQKYNRDKLAEVMAKVYEEQGLPQAQTLARAAAVSEPARTWVEELTFLRFHADRTKRFYLDALETARDYMEAAPGRALPNDIKQDMFGWYNSARFLDARQNLVVRRHAQSLRSQQEDIWSLGQFNLQKGEPDADEALNILGTRPEDIQADSHFAKVVEAIDDNRPDTLHELIETAKIEGVNPKVKLDKDWFNTHMRYGTALIKDSMLMSPMSQIKMNAGSNVTMVVAGPLQQTMENGFRMMPVGSSLISDPWRQALEIHSVAFQFANNALAGTWKSDLRKAFWEGLGNYNTNLDVHGSRDRMTREAEIREMQAVLNTPYLRSPQQVMIDPKTGEELPGNWLHAAVEPKNLAVLTNKLQAAARILFLTKPDGLQKQGLNRGQAAWMAVAGPEPGGPSKLNAGSIDTMLPWKPALRSMGAVDEVFGKWQYLYSLRSELEVQSRMKAAELGLNTPEKRVQWVADRLDEAVYSASPTEANIKAYRKANGLPDGSQGSMDGLPDGLSDDDIAARITAENLAGGPTMATEESVEAMQRSMELRQQKPPGSGNPNSLASHADDAVMKLRQHWAGERFILPFWRSPVGALFQNVGLAVQPATDLGKLILKKNQLTEKEIARTQAGWTLSTALLGAFGALETTGQIYGSQERDPAKRNTIFGVPLGGLPLAETLLIWKDIKDAIDDGRESQYDAVTAASAVGKILTATLLRSSGLQQYAILMDALQDGSKTSIDRLRRYVGFMGQSQIPFVGAYRTLERAAGMGAGDFFRDGAETPEEDWRYDADDPINQLRENLANFAREMAYDTLPVIAGVMQEPRKARNHLGDPIGHIGGINLSRVIPFFPSAWPSDEASRRVYSELEHLKRLDPPPALLKRNLDGIGMSAELQEEYNDLIGTTVAPKEGMIPTALLGLVGKVPKLTFKTPISVATESGYRLEDKSSVELPISQLLDKVTPGRTRKQALDEMFKSDWYQSYQRDPRFSTRPPGGLPTSVRSERVATKLVDGINSYYHELAVQELERRAVSGESPAAAAWSAKKTELARKVFEESMKLLAPASGVMSAD